MGNFVPNDCGKSGIVFRDLEKPGVNTHFSARQGKGVGNRVVKNNKLPFGMWHRHDDGEALADALRCGFVGSILRDLFSLRIF